MTQDYYITILNLIKNNKSSMNDEELAHLLADEIRSIVEIEISEFLDEYRRKYESTN